MAVRGRDASNSRRRLWRKAGNVPMLWQQSRSAWRARITAIICGLAAANLPNAASGTDTDLMRWLGTTAGYALQLATPTNDPWLAGRELLNRGLAGTFVRAPQVAPAPLARLNLGLSFDPALQPRYALSTTQPLLARAGHVTAINLHGQVAYDTRGGTDGVLGLRYHNHWHDQDVSLNVQGGMEDRWLVGLQRRRLGAEGHLSSLEVRANLYDDVPARPASHEIARRRLDGYDLAVGAPLPFLSGARVQASRSWQSGVDGATTTTADRIGLLLDPVLALEIQTDSQSQSGRRVWSTQLRWRVKLGG
jgi:hypothetical protein